MKPKSRLRKIVFLIGQLLTLHLNRMIVHASVIKAEFSQPKQLAALRYMNNSVTTFLHLTHANAEVCRI
jgi:hypothetical protein